MSIATQILIALFSGAFLLYVINLIVRGKLMLRYSLIWMALSLVLIICAVFPAPISWISAIFGFGLSSNFIFLLGLFLLMVFSLSLSVIASKEAEGIKNLAQRLAIVESELRSLRKNGIKERD